VVPNHGCHESSHSGRCHSGAALRHQTPWQPTALPCSLQPAAAQTLSDFTIPVGRCHPGMAHTHTHTHTQAGRQAGRQVMAAEVSPEDALCQSCMVVRSVVPAALHTLNGSSGDPLREAEQAADDRFSGVSHDSPYRHPRNTDPHTHMHWPTNIPDTLCNLKGLI
jgi:hypothetical protein